MSTFKISINEMVFVHIVATLEILIRSDEAFRVIGFRHHTYRWRRILMKYYSKLLKSDVVLCLKNDP